MKVKSFEKNGVKVELTQTPYGYEVVKMFGDKEVYMKPGLLYNEADKEFNKLVESEMNHDKLV